MKHPESVQGLSAKELAKEFMGTTYGYQLDFYRSMVDQYNDESKADTKRRYLELAALLSLVQNLLEMVVDAMVIVWELCESRTNK